MAKMISGIMIAVTEGLMNLTGVQSGFLVWIFLIFGILVGLAAAGMVRRFLVYQPLERQKQRRIAKELAQAFRILFVPPSAPAEEIRRQYRLLSEQYHPGRYAAQGPEYVQMASEKLREIQRAYETLKAHGRV